MKLDVNKGCNLYGPSADLRPFGVGLLALLAVEVKV